MTLIVLPHGDLHLALGDPAFSSVQLKLFVQGLADAAGHYTLFDETPTGTFLTWSPYNAVGSRDQSSVSVNAGTITATRLGTTFIVTKAAGRYAVVRVQVHQHMVGWWFGNASLTTALDANVGHTQPSIYAQFSDDGNGTDLVGDITGHGFVPLDIADTSVCVLDDRDHRARLRGLRVGTTQLSGTLLGSTQSLQVKVVDYGAARNNLQAEKTCPRAVEDAHNMLFLPEGFTSSDADRALFARAVRETKDSLFRCARHEPFKALTDSFRVYSAYQESEQHLLTVGFQVKDNNDGPAASGTRLPSDHLDYTVSPGDYTAADLVRIVGLPQRGENRSANDLKALWASQSLTNYQANKVSNTTVNAWKAGTSLGFLEARDTFFGLMVGQRYADHAWFIDNPAVTAPAADDPSDANLQPFIDAVYSWFRKRGTTRSITPDPRRHPPELFSYNGESRDCAIMRYIGASSLTAAPHTNVGVQWVPQPGSFIRSRGMVAVIVNDGINGGTNINDNTLTCLTIDSATRLGFEYVPTNPPTQKKMRRKPASAPKLDVPGTINTVVHEFGHSFALGDEYESRGGNAPAGSSSYDNLATLEDVQRSGGPVGQIDPAKVKWLKLPRIKRAARLVAPAARVGASLEVMIDPDWVGPFDVAKHENASVTLRDWAPNPDGQQLHAVTEVNGLTVSDYDYDTGKIVLGGPGVPATLPAVFGPGSMIYVQLRDDSDQPLNVVERAVLTHLTSNRAPLNKDTDTLLRSDKDDLPVSIANFKPPCTASRLIGVFEGGDYYAGHRYRPAGACKMRDNAGEFCHVCKWLITNRVDPNRHIWLDFGFYPKAKKNG